MPSSDQSTAPLPIIPFNLLICAYLFISHDWVVLFLDAVKLTDEVEDHLRALNIERKEYSDIWAVLCWRDWGFSGASSFRIRIHAHIKGNKSWSIVAQGMFQLREINCVILY